MFCLHSCDGCCCRTAETCCDSVAKVVHASGLVSVVDSVTTKITGISIFIFAAGLWFIKIRWASLCMVIFLAVCMRVVPDSRMRELIRTPAALPPCRLAHGQRLQYPLIKKDTLNYSRIPNMT